MLDPEKAQQVTYCIPNWLRDEQIKSACARAIPRLDGDPKSTPVRGDRIAVVCYGPSLAETWELIRDFEFVITVSGAHKFLLERGIVPTWHVEVDPRAHKVELLGAPHRQVEYLIASTCHPSYFDHLAYFNVRLWHVFDNDVEALRTLPRGEWAVTGGCNVGLRAMTLARLKGFTEQHIFGMDGSIANDSSHAAAHPNAATGKHLSECEYKGRAYKTTSAMLESARQTWHELDMMPDVRPTFYGEGLVQAMAKHYVPTPKKGNVLAFAKPELISREYRELNADLHRANPAFGVGGERQAKTVLKLAESLNTKNILDYGCGKGRLAKALPFQIAEYDPAIPGRDESPKPADLVVCTDVLEHIEPDKIVYVLDDLRRVTRELGYFLIHTGPSSKTLADGRNAHVLQRDRAWWERMLGKFFTIGKVIEVKPLLYVVVAPKQVLAAKAGKTSAVEVLERMKVEAKAGK